MNITSVRVAPFVKKHPIYEAVEDSVSADVILKAYSDYYDEFYANAKNIPYYPALIFAGECVLKQYGDVVRTLADYRGDMFVSDREIAALACALAQYRVI